MNFMRSNKRRQSRIMGALITWVVVLLGMSGCMTQDPIASESESIEKGIIRVEDDMTTDYTPLEKQELLELEGADNPAGFLQDKCSNVMVQILAGNLLGSGVIVASNQSYLWIATAGHVLDKVEAPVRITFADGFEVETSLMKRLDPQDIAILKVPRKDLVEQTLAGMDDHGHFYRTAILSQEAFEQAGVGDLVIAMGSKHGAGEDAYAGTILQDYIYLEDFGANMMVAEVVATPGMSGGGLFDAKGRLLGIICGVSEDDEVAVSSILSILALELAGNE